MRGTIVNVRKLHCITVEMSTCLFVSCRSKHDTKYGPCHVACHADILDMTQPSCSCHEHSPKYFMPYRSSNRAERPCHDPPSKWHGQSTSSILRVPNPFAPRYIMALAVGFENPTVIVFMWMYTSPAHQIIYSL